MAKTRKTKKHLFSSITSTTGKALKVVNNGLNTVGSVAKGVVVKSSPIIENGVSTVYGTMASGIDLGVKGVKTVAKGLNMKTKKRRTKHNKRKHKRTNKRRY
jgi:phage-related protein